MFDAMNLSSKEILKNTSLIIYSLKYLLIDFICSLYIIVDCYKVYIKTNASNNSCRLYQIQIVVQEILMLSYKKSIETPFQCFLYLSHKR